MGECINWAVSLIMVIKQNQLCGWGFSFPMAHIQKHAIEQFGLRRVPRRSKILRE
jgi:hypothetical protein